MKIVVTGSYNGQDSLGDECLLKAVVERLHYQRPDAIIDVQLHGVDQPVVQHYAKVHGLEVSQGLQSAMWRMSHVLQRLRVPRTIAETSSLRQISWAAKFRMFGADSALDRLKKCDAFFIYGGTQFSGQWFKLNAPAYMKSAEVVRSAGGQVFFGPQQYGPLSAENAQALRSAFNGLINDWRTRNPLDADLLEVDSEKRKVREVYDEVFSATRLYPSLTPKPAQHILVNLRAMTFDDEQALDRDVYYAFANLIDRLVAHYNLPVVFFGVSDATFCDDEAAFAAIRDISGFPEKLSSVGRVRDEYHLFELAQEARLTISMSFHGCLLSAIAGAPFIAVTEGEYYDYKYVGFDKYAGYQQTPLISLSKCDVQNDFDRIKVFTDKFDWKIVKDIRLKASEITDGFYFDAIGHNSMI